MRQLIRCCTHTQGNFPRLFSFLLYAVGARTAESQILITSLTIGTAAVLIGYSFLRRMAGELFATIAMLLLVTDYLMFAQWQVNTYRVWHCFFFFAAFATVHGYSDWRRGIWLPATIALYAGLLYWELVFAFFTSVAAGLYAIWLYRSWALYYRDRGCAGRRRLFGFDHHRGPTRPISDGRTSLPI